MKAKKIKKTEKKQCNINDVSVAKHPFCLSCEHWKKQVGNIYCQNCIDNSQFEKAKWTLTAEAKNRQGNEQPPFSLHEW